MATNTFTVACDSASGSPTEDCPSGPGLPQDSSKVGNPEPNYGNDVASRSNEQRAWAHGRNAQTQLMTCQDALQKTGLANQQERMRNQQLRAMIHRLAAEHRHSQQRHTRLEVEHRQLHVDYSSIQQALQMSERGRADLERRVGAQWQTLSKFARLFQTLRVYIAGDQLPEDERDIDVGALLLENDNLQQELGNLRHILMDDTERLGQAQRDMASSREVQEALLSTVRDRDELQKKLADALQAGDGLQARFVHDMNVRDQRLAEMQRNLVKTKQEVRRLRLSHRQSTNA